MQPQELNKSKLADINEEKRYYKKGEDVPKGVMLAKDCIKENLRDIS